jgi:hypothetical protein
MKPKLARLRRPKALARPFNPNISAIFSYKGKKKKPANQQKKEKKIKKESMNPQWKSKAKRGN